MTPPTRLALDGPLLLAVEELDNCWNDEGDHIEWDSDVLPERLLALRKAYAALTAQGEPDVETEPARLAWARLREVLDSGVFDLPIGEDVTYSRGYSAGIGAAKQSFRALLDSLSPKQGNGR